MEKTTTLWGGFEITYGPTRDGYRAHAVPRDRAKEIGLTNITVNVQHSKDLLPTVFRRIADAWSPSLTADERCRNSLPIGSFTPHSSECRSCHHGVHSSYMPVCPGCKRSVCFNCGACLCGYAGPRKGFA